MTVARAERRPPLTVGGVTVSAGRRKRFEVPVARLATGTDLSMPITVLHGRGEGPRVWVSAAIHGDELNGVEIVRRVLAAVDARRLRGSLVAVPVVNVFGFVNESRYLPDRRDLNRSFPGSSRGSLASRLARLFLDTVVEGSAYGIDLHTGSNHRDNHPQIRADLEDDETRRLAEAFGAPLIVHSSLRDGSLREAATSRGIRVLLYEAGEAYRFSGDAIRLGSAGVLRVLAHLGMIDGEEVESAAPPVEIARSSWVRARRSGLVILATDLGERVAVGDALATISDASGGRAATLRAPFDGWVIGINRHPLVHRGDAVAHVGAGTA